MPKAVPRHHGRRPIRGIERATERIADADTDERAERNGLEEFTAPQGAASDDIADFLESLGGDADMQVHRIKPDGTTAFCGTIGLEGYSLDSIAAFGPGKYSLKFRRVGDAGRRVFAGTKRVEIDAAAARAVTPAVGAAAVVTASPDMNDVIKAGVLSLFDAQQRGQQTLLATMTQLREAGQRPPIDFARILEASAPLVASLLTLFVTKRGGADALTAKDALDLAMRMREAMAPPKATGLSEMADNIGALRDMAGMFGDHGSDRPGALDRVLDAVAPLLVARVAPMLSAGAPLAAAPAVASIPPAVAPPTATARVAAVAPVPDHPASPEETMVLQALAFLKKWEPGIAKWAREGRDPALYADVLLDEIPADALDAVATFLRSPDALTTLVTAAPMLAAYREWCGELIAAMIEPRASDDAPVHATPGTPPALEE